MKLFYILFDRLKRFMSMILYSEFYDSILSLMYSTVSIKCFQSGTERSFGVRQKLSANEYGLTSLYQAAMCFMEEV